MEIRPGVTLRGKYRLDAVIGRGGMGQVFAATDLETGGQVAVKVVSRLIFDEVLMARLHREADAASRIRSDYVPPVLEVASTDDGEVFLVMERLVGETLAQRLKDKETLPWTEVAQIGEDVLRGLIDAHTAGIIHRDLKPSNVFLAMKHGRTRAMVLDFGVCKIDVVDAERLTSTGESIGTAAYMAPEQIRAASKVDERADLYAFGALVFEMLAGRLPHEGPTQMAILASKLENDADRLVDYARGEVPSGLHELVPRTLARDPKDRPASAQELLRAWRALSGSRLVAPTPGAPFGVIVAADEAPTQHSMPELPGSEIDSRPTQTALTAGVSLRKGSSGRLALVLAGFGLALGFAAVAAFFARAPKTDASELSAVTESPAAAADPPASGLAPLPMPVPMPAPVFAPEPAAMPTVTPSDLVSEPTADAGVAFVRRITPRVRVTRPPVVASPPRPSAQHITDKPRY